MFGGYLLLTLCLLPSISNGAIVLRTSTTNQAWVDYKSYFNKEYDGVTETLKKEAFMKSLEFVLVRNLAHDLTDESYQAGLNAVSDFTPDEMVCHRDEDVYQDDTLRVGIDENETEMEGAQCMCGTKPCPNQLDWVQKGRVLPVGEQKCGDCYAWAATYALSSAAAIQKNSNPLDLSVQESKDCTYAYEINSGCHGGSAFYVYNGLANRTHGKSVKTKDYDHYNTNEGRLTCNHTAINKAIPVVTVKQSGRHIETGQRDDCKLRQQLSKGPVATNMCVSSDVQHLTQKSASAIYSNFKCTTECQSEMKKNNETVQETNHAVMIVGYTKDAWLVQNSWGSHWGYKGRAYFAVGPSGSKRICNLATRTYWPIL